LGLVPNIEWILGNGQDLQQIPDEAIDFVFSFWVLQHVPEPSIVLNYIREAERVMKRNGTAFLQFRLLPQNARLVALKYHITTHPQTALGYGSWIQRNSRKIRPAV
jgi:ubiquinone/menaquinone biosynthesis C-methylase UbiE